MRIIEEYDVKIFTDNIEENALEQIKEPSNPQLSPSMSFLRVHVLS